MRAVAAGRLAVAARPVAGDGQQQRGHAEHLQRRRVGEQAAEEADGGPGRAAPRSSAIATTTTSSRSGEPPPISKPPSTVTWRTAATRTIAPSFSASSVSLTAPAPFGTSTTTASSEPKSTDGPDLDPQVQVGVGAADEGDAADGDPAREQRRQLAALRARGDDLVALVHLVPLLDAGEDERAAAGAAVLDEPGRLGLQVARRDARRLVGEQRHLRRVGRDRRDAADEPVGVHDGVVDADAVVAAGGDHDLLHEQRRRVRRSRPRTPGRSRRDTSAAPCSRGTPAASGSPRTRCGTAPPPGAAARSRGGAARPRPWPRRGRRTSRTRPGTGARRARRRPGAAAGRSRRRSARRAAGRRAASRNEIVIIVSESSTSSPTTMRRLKAVALREGYLDPAGRWT